MSPLSTSPLSTLLRTSHAAGLCSASGLRLPSSPFNFTLSYLLDDLPASKTVGFQAVTPDAFTFLVRHGSLPPSLPISAVHLAGAYPPAPGAACRQWRMDGEAAALPISSPALLSTAPASSLAQMLASKAWGARPAGPGGDAFHGGGEGWGLLPAGRRGEFEALVDGYKARLAEGVPGEMLEEVVGAVALYEVRPDRVELCEAGPDMWERTEWWREDGGEGFKEPLALLPYT
jgi:hypothetical protein